MRSDALSDAKKRTRSLQHQLYLANLAIANARQAYYVRNLCMFGDAVPSKFTHMLEELQLYKAAGCHPTTLHHTLDEVQAYFERHTGCAGI